VELKSSAVSDAKEELWSHLEVLAKLISRRDFVISGFALGFLNRIPIADDNTDLLAACESVLKTASARVLDDLWDERGRETPTDPDDANDLQKVFGLFIKDSSSKSEFLLTKNFAGKPTSSNGIDFVLPYADPDGIPLDALLRQRIAAHSLPRLTTRSGEKTSSYAEPVPLIEFPKPATTLNISFQYLGTEDLTATTFPTQVANNSGDIQINISSGFVRRVMQSCIYAYPVIRDSRTVLWPTLKLLQGPGDSILVESEAGPTSITLLPLLCVVNKRAYAFNTDQQQIVAVTGSFHRTLETFMKLRQGQNLGKDFDVKKLRSDIQILAAIFQMFFLAVNFIVCHEVAHAVYLHTATSDQKRNREQELIADQAATLHLFMTALTDSLDANHSWTRYWKYSLVGSEPLEERLTWFERLFGFGLATNIALDVLGSHASATHPENEERWARNVRVWNNCSLAFSNITTLKG
jgi:hypothetical protein